MSVCLITRNGKRIGIANHDSAGLGVLAWFHHNVAAYSVDHATQHEGYAIEELDSVDCGEVEELINAICARAGVTMEAVFIPFSQSRNAKPGKDGKVWRSLNWRVKIQRHGRDVIETDYAQGEAHTPAYKAKLPSGFKTSDFYARQLREQNVTHEIETGRTARRLGGADGVLMPGVPIPAPSIGDVMQSLARDADAIDAASFEDWAAEYGYDTDSREAERIYRACLEIGTKLRAGLGSHLLEEIRLAASFN